MSTTEEMRYKLGEVCRIADVQPYVLRYWESEFAALAPAKNSSGQRIYRRRDIETVVAFPLPDHENPEGSPEAMVPDYRNELDFRTTVDGRPAPLTLVETATFRGHDVTGWRAYEIVRLGVGIKPVHVAVRDLAKVRGVAVPKALLTTDWAAAIADPAVDVAVELIGGTTIARTVVGAALRQETTALSTVGQLVVAPGGLLTHAPNSSARSFVVNLSGASGASISDGQGQGTITNDDRPATLIVKKVVVNDSGGTATADDFSFQVNGGSRPSSFSESKP